MRKLDFIVIGAQKSGTTSLHEYLSRHPEIGVGTKKELHYFDKDIYFKKGINYKEYHRFFDFNGGEVVYGETTPSYIYKEKFIDRIKEYNPDIKLIVLLRNPIKRAFSHWNMRRKRGNESRPFHTCVLSELELIKDKKYKADLNHYLDRGRYYRQVKYLLDNFPSENIKIFNSNELKLSPSDTLNSIFDFLKLDKDKYKFSPVEKHMLKYNSELQQETVELLEDFYKEDTERLLTLLEWDKHTLSFK
jgi:hypothetical protein